MPDDARQIVREAAHSGATETARVMAALAQTVSVAAYWQPPYEEDKILSSPDVATELDPVAELLLANPATGWWGAPLASDTQRLTQFLDAPVPPDAPDLRDPRGKLEAWHEEQLCLNEDFRAVREGRSQRAEQEIGWSVYREPDDGPAEDYARLSGTWWSTPNRWEVLSTAREVSGIGPVALWLTEDELGWKNAHCWPVAAARAARVCEIGDTQGWADLVARYPLDVTDSRRPDWKWATGCNGPWLIPDWSAVAREYDAVHLTVLGYLTTSGRPIPIGDEHWTLLAGWDPDATFWLSGSLMISGAVERWALDDEHRWISVR